MTFNTEYSNINLLFSALLIEELWRLGVRHCCIAPGSRSAPLTLMAAEHQQLTRHIHFDERGLGFFALGLAKSRREPVAIITTSGTAVANLYPALIEARQAGIPLVVITADRPPELIDCGANQAIEQRTIFSDYPRAVLNLPTPDDQISVNWVLTSIDQAFAKSCQQGLPLHINCQFREPLYPQGESHDYSEIFVNAGKWLHNKHPYTVYQLPEFTTLPEPANWSEFVVGKGIVVAGRIDAGTDVEAIVRLATTLGWPLIADVQSQLHGHPATLKYADLLLANDRGRSVLGRADRIFQVGGFLVSKRLDEFLGQQNWQYYFMLDREFRRIDTAHRQTLRMVGCVAESCHRLAEAMTVQERWGGELYELSNSIADQVDTRIMADELTERWVCHTLPRQLSNDTQLFIGNSLPIRMVDMFSDTQISRVFANRGVSGIDGLLATAAGCCAGLSAPTVMLVGDVSFLHDLNSLQLIRQLLHPMVVILLNNDGGGIFNMLPMGDAVEKRMDYFVTPHGLTAQHAATMFGLTYHAPETKESFLQFLQEAMQRPIQEPVQQPAGTIIEVFTAQGQGADNLRQMVQQVKSL